jgi:hypothetical protein
MAWTASTLAVEAIWNRRFCERLFLAFFVLGAIMLSHGSKVSQGIVFR